jgi:hypothetical protein
LGARFVPEREAVVQRSALPARHRQLRGEPAAWLVPARAHLQPAPWEVRLQPVVSFQPRAAAGVLRDAGVALSARRYAAVVWSEALSESAATASRLEPVSWSGPAIAWHPRAVAALEMARFSEVPATVTVTGSAQLVAWARQAAALPPVEACGRVVRRWAVAAHAEPA